MLDESIISIKGIGPRKADILKKEAGIETIEDLLYYIPRKYVDRSSFKRIRDCFVNEIVTVAGTIEDITVTGKGKKRLEVTINDGSDTLTGVFFGGIQFLGKRFNNNDFVIFSGKINFYNKKQIVHPDFDFIEHQSNIKSINTGRIVPLYRSTEKLKSIGFDSRGFRKIFRAVLDDYLQYIEETIDPAIIEAVSLIGLKEALFSIHFPDTFDQAESARRRLAFSEIFFMQYYLSLVRKYSREISKQQSIPINTDYYNAFVSRLPFELTSDQKNAIDEVRNDIEADFPMNRLLQGDVGSGKTIIAIASSLLTVGQGRQVAIMAPTEILATQHYNTFTSLVCDNIEISLLTGSINQTDKKRVYESIENGKVDIVIGTHALIQDVVSFKSLGLTVIDEQHRFGVKQRSQLREKGKNTDLLVMTATPIPRSLSLTLYGDLDVSVIREKPAERIDIKTFHFTESRLQGVYNSMRKYISQGRQIYYVLPIIEESEKIDLKSAMNVYYNLGEKIFPDLNVALMHGKMKQIEKDDVMAQFKNGSIHILVSTTVIEVGIDIPNANVIVIEHAERFGLSQLHQLRGRVGRGEHQSFCVLITPDDISDDSMRRLNILINSNDGFLIAEEDLKLRGAGDVIGLKQHGQSVSFEFVDLSLDIDLIESARTFAQNKVLETDSVAEILRHIDDEKYKSLVKGIRKKRILSILS